MSTDQGLAAVRLPRWERTDAAAGSQLRGLLATWLARFAESGHFVAPQHQGTYFSGVHSKRFPNEWYGLTTINRCPPPCYYSLERC